MALGFEWNEQKGASSLDKHGVGFDEATTAFEDPFSLTIADPAHSGDEDRLVLVTESCRGRVVGVTPMTGRSSRCVADGAPVSGNTAGQRAVKPGRGPNSRRPQSVDRPLHQIGSGREAARMRDIPYRTTPTLPRGT